MPRPFLPIGALAAVCLFAAGCGGSSGDDNAESRADTTAQTVPASQPTEFPSAEGKTLLTLRQGLAEGPIFAPGVGLIDVRRERFSFALIDRSRKQITGAQVAVYVADSQGGQVRGPFMARAESLAVDKQFESRTAAQDPTSAKEIYVARLPFERRGQNLVMGIARLDGRLVATSVGQVIVGARRAGPPDVGEKAIKVSTPTLADVHGNASKISTRVPPATDLLQHDLADVLGKRPVVLTFATPRLCASRTCAPVVDIVEQVKAGTGSRAAFIHVEVYKENDVQKGYLPQLLKWRLPSEPWTFVIDRSGIVRERFEGALSVDELRKAVKKVV